MRFFNGQPVELLAPAGNFDIFKAIVDAKCDAIYFGGSILNMRLIRKGFNFTNDELREAVKIAHDKGKKVYITVNNLISGEEIDTAKEYLTFLETCRPDGLIVQDLAIHNIIQSLGLSLELHASVMMNVHNLEMIRQLEELGFTRVVLSRDMDLATVKKLHQQTTVEFEYFTHGDMCVSHGAQCIYSSMLFGMSSNRGRCLKPCRWAYTPMHDKYQFPETYPLAVKDMCMYQHLPDMLEAGIISFKLEGRMRDKDFIVNQTNLYGEALDRYIADPSSYDYEEGMQYLTENRKRDLSTAYAFGKPGLSNINTRYEGTGIFYSTGKMFSTPTEEPPITPARTEKIKQAIAERTPQVKQDTSGDASSEIRGDIGISVRVHSISQALTAIKAGADRIYLTGDVYQPNEPFTAEDIRTLTAHKGNAEIYLAFPRMMFDREFAEYDQLLSEELGIDGLLVTNMGALYRYRQLNLPMIGDFSLNIYNALAVESYKNLGLDEYTLSLETPLSDSLSLITDAPLPVEAIAHGKQVIMYLDHDLYDIPKYVEPEKELEVNRETGGAFSHTVKLKTEKGVLEVHKDQYERNHILANYELNLLPILPDLINLGIARIRIEDIYTEKQLETIISAYKNTIDTRTSAELAPTNGKFTYGSLQHD